MVDIEINESKTPFPKITETTDYYQDGKLTIPDADYTRERREARTAALNKYHVERFSELCTLMNESEVHGNILRAHLKFTVIDPEKIYRAAKKLGLEIPAAVDAGAQDMTAPPTFTENPPEIRWRGVVVPILHDSNQLCFCRVAFRKKVGEIFSWDEVAEEIERLEYEDGDIKWRSVYDAVYDINTKIKAKCGKKLFTSTRKSFSRTA